MWSRRQSVRKQGVADRNRRARSPEVVHPLESLEERSLLSSTTLAGLPHIAVPAELHTLARRHLVAARWQGALSPRPAFRMQGPLNQRIVGGHVTKAPQFYSEYTGPRLPELNGTGAQGQLVLSVGYVFTGRVLAPINQAHTSYFVFGIDRGGAKGPMDITPPTPDGGVNFSGGTSLVMFPRRPNIFVDALVTVAVGPSGTQGTVRLMGQTPGESTPLPPENIQISGRDVTVVVPPRLLPPNGLPADGFAYAFWTRSDALGAASVASFVPEYNVTRIGFHP